MTTPDTITLDVQTAREIERAMAGASSLASMVVMSDETDGSQSEDQAIIEALRSQLSAALSKLREKLK